MCAFAISALVLWHVLPWAIPRLMALGAVHTFNGVGAGGSYVTILLTVEALSHTSRPAVQDGRQAVAVPEDPLVDRTLTGTGDVNSTISEPDFPLGMRSQLILAISASP